MQRRWRPSWPVNIDLVLAPLTRGRYDPVARRTVRQLWWLTGATPAGPATLQLRREGPEIVGSTWGAGADWFLGRLPVLLGDADDPAGFAPQPTTIVGVQWARHGANWRVPATGLVLATAAQAVLEQRVTGIESRRAWFALCRDHGAPAPGPAPEGMRVPPDADALAAIPSWWWHGAGVDNQRAATVQRLARQGLGSTDAAVAARRLAAVPGVGPWTCAEVGFRALGDPDAVSVGDFHLANLVGYALTGRARSTDAEMLELLADYAPHRHRAVRMIELAGMRPPRFGPRRALPTHL